MSSSWAANSLVNHMATETFTMVVSSSLPIFMSLSTSSSLHLKTFNYFPLVATECNMEGKLFRWYHLMSLQTMCSLVNLHLRASLISPAVTDFRGGFENLLMQLFVRMYREVPLVQGVAIDPCQDLRAMLTFEHKIKCGSTADRLVQSRSSCTTMVSVFYFSMTNSKCASCLIIEIRT